MRGNNEVNCRTWKSGKEYENTRHKLGFIDELSKELKIYDFKEKFEGLWEKEIIKEKILLLKPQTYMNLSE